jgi:hypothetical protein
MRVSHIKNETGIYSRPTVKITLTPGKPLTDEEKAAIIKVFEAATDPGPTLDDIGNSLLSALKRLGVKFIKKPPPLTNWPAGFTLVNFNRPTNATLALAPSQHADHRAIQCYRELFLVRDSIARGEMTEAAAMHAFRLGSRLEMLRVMPHEPLAAKGRQVTAGQKRAVVKSRSNRTGDIATRLKRAKIIEILQQPPAPVRLGGKIERLAERSGITPRHARRLLKQFQIS